MCISASPGSVASCQCLQLVFVAGGWRHSLHKAACLARAPWLEFRFMSTKHLMWPTACQASGSSTVSLPLPFFFTGWCLRLLESEVPCPPPCVAGLSLFKHQGLGGFGGGRSQGCHGYLLSRASLLPGSTNLFRHHLPSSSIVDEFKCG